jgi:hypothetical protein
LRGKAKSEGGSGRVSTLRRKPKTRSKNGHRSPRKSTVRRNRKSRNRRPAYAHV